MLHAANGANAERSFGKDDVAKRPLGSEILS
jgi:hypothetical protein